MVNQPFKYCLNSVLEAADEKTEIVLVNDGNEVAFFSPSCENLKVIKTSGNQGPAYARNLGAQQATSDLICFIDSDILVPKGLFKSIEKIFQENENLSAIFGSYDDAPGDPAFLSQYRNLLHHYVHQNSNEDASTFWTGCGAIKRGVFLQMKGFNGALYKNPEIEDIELGYRLKNAGHKIRLVKNLQVKHLKKWTPKKLIQADLFHRAIPWTKLILSQTQVPNDLNLKIANKISVALSFLIPVFMIGYFFTALFLLPLIALISFFLSLNAKLYLFFYQKKGFFFAIKSLPWHFLFYFLSGIGYCIGLLQCVKSALISEPTARR